MRESIRVHYLKIWQEHFDAIVRDEKRADLRSTSDRDFRVGDFVIFIAYDPVARKPDYRQRVARRIAHILPGGQYGLEQGHAMLSIELPDSATALLLLGPLEIRVIKPVVEKTA